MIRAAILPILLLGLGVQAVAAADGGGSEAAFRDCDACPEMLVVRGGSWLTNPDWQRTTFRGRDPEEVRYSFFGFRVARSLPK